MLATQHVSTSGPYMLLSPGHAGLQGQGDAAEQAAVRHSECKHLRNRLAVLYFSAHRSLSIYVCMYVLYCIFFFHETVFIPKQRSVHTYTYNNTIVHRNNISC